MGDRWHHHRHAAMGAAMIDYAQQLKDTVMGNAYFGDAFISPLVHCADKLTYEDRLCLLRYQMGLNTEIDYDSIQSIINRIRVIK